MGVWAISVRAVLTLALLVAAPAAFADHNLSVQAADEQRVALVIGNAAYQQGALKNPVNDARAMAERLQRLGFVVIKRENLKTRDIGPTMREFRSRLSAGATALFFYAGHGLQVKGVNYLPTVDADIEAEDDVYTQALDVAKVLELMDEAKTRVNLVFLDACRNNPFSRRFRSVSQGLAKIDAPSGTLISFATRPGSVAADGDGMNGLYTEYLLKHMEEPGLPIEQVLKRTGAGVKLASKGKQEPWSEGLIEGEFYFKANVQFGTEAHVTSTVAPVRVQTAAEVEQELWDTIKDSRDPKEFNEYLSNYPNGRFAALARARLRSMGSTQSASISASAPMTEAASKAVKALGQFLLQVEAPVGSAKWIYRDIIAEDCRLKYTRYIYITQFPDKQEVEISSLRSFVSADARTTSIIDGTMNAVNLDFDGDVVVLSHDGTAFGRYKHASLGFASLDQANAWKKLLYDAAAACK